MAYIFLLNACKFKENEEIVDQNILDSIHTKEELTLTNMTH